MGFSNINEFDAVISCVCGLSSLLTQMSTKQLFLRVVSRAILVQIELEIRCGFIVSKCAFLGFRGIREKKKKRRNCKSESSLSFLT